MEQAAQDFAQTYVSLLTWSWSWWSGSGDPGIAQVGQVVTAVRPVTRWATSALLALAVVAGGFALVVRRRGSDLAAIVLGLTRVLLVVSAGWLVFASAWSLGDRIGRWIVGGGNGVGELRDHVAEASTEAEPVVALTLSIVGVACCLAFACVLLVRVVLGVVLAAGMPVLAAGSLLSGPALRGAGAWAVAVVAFDPLSALVYRVGHALAMQTEQPVVVLLVACVTSFMAACMFPLAARVAGTSR
jgi:hypothetical protein